LILPVLLGLDVRGLNDTELGLLGCGLQFIVATDTFLRRRNLRCVILRTRFSGLTYRRAAKAEPALHSPNGLCDAEPIREPDPEHYDHALAPAQPCDELPPSHPPSPNSS
jgi:hypothetical protein